MQLRALLLPLLVVTVLAASSSIAFATKPLMNIVRGKYTLDKPLATCHLCHTFDEKKNEEADKRNLNDYGHDVANEPRLRPLLEVEDENHKYSEKERALIIEVLKSLEAEDSDKDGATNMEELNAGTFPGDKNSKPTKK